LELPSTQGLWEQCSGKVLVVDFPFKEKHLRGQVFLREFKENVNSEELIWHLDKEDRIVVPLKCEGWRLQMDNELPKPLLEGKEYFIPKMTYHRVLKGSGDLKIKLIKLESENDLRIHLR